MTAQPIGELLRERAVQEPSAPAVTCGALTIGWRELDERSNRLARVLREQGAGFGSLVAIVLPNGVDMYVASFAAWKLGATPLPLSPGMPPAELDALVALADPAAVIGPDTAPGGRATIPAASIPSQEADAGPLPLAVSPAWKANASGGSTGLPKVIVTTQPAMVDPVAMTAPFEMPRHGVHLVCGPLYHNAPYGLSMMALFMGNHVVVLPRFDAGDALDAVDRHTVEWVTLVPTMMQRLLRLIDAEPSRWSLVSLRKVWHLAAPCPPWLKERWIELVGPDALMELYGGTEGQAMTAISGREWLTHRGSVGRPRFGQIRVLDDSGAEVPPGVVGDIYMKADGGPGSTYRYVGAEPVARGEWEWIGDMGWRDEDGYVYLSDRRVDMILSGGANVYPAEVEAVLLAHPAVDSCVVIGVPDADLGKRVHAVVHATSAVTEAELLAFTAQSIARYKVPRSVHFVDKSLRDDAGKARRRQIAEEEAARLRGG